MNGSEAKPSVSNTMMSASSALQKLFFAIFQRRTYAFFASSTPIASILQLVSRMPAESMSLMGKPFKCASK